MKKYTYIVVFGLCVQLGAMVPGAPRGLLARCQTRVANTYLERHINDHEMVVWALLGGADVNARSSMGYHMINQAIYSRSLPGVIALLYGGADVKTADSSPLVIMVNGAMCHRVFLPIDWATWLKNTSQQSRIIWHLMRTYQQPKDLNRTKSDYISLGVPDEDAEQLVQMTQKVFDDFEWLKRSHGDDVSVRAFSARAAAVVHFGKPGLGRAGVFVTAMRRGSL